MAKKSIRDLLVVLVSLSFSACASSGGSAAGGGANAGAPAGRVELDGTVWKMPVSHSKIDGRTVRFRKEANTYVGYLQDFGLQLRDVPGVRKDMRFFTLEPGKHENEYFGFYEAPGGDGIPIAHEVTVTVEPKTFTWSLESVTWERVE